MSRQKLSIPKIFINSIPKSGTHLLQQILVGIPGAQGGPLILMWEDWLLQIRKLSPGEVGLGHLHYQKDISETLSNLNIKRVFLYRDPRDVVVSLVYFIMKEPSHPLHLYFTRGLSNTNERISAIISGIDEDIVKKYKIVSGLYYPNINEFYSYYTGWLDDRNTLCIKYETLVESKESCLTSINKILEYLLNIDKNNLASYDHISQLMMKNINPKYSPTFRKGAFLLEGFSGT